MKKTLGLVAALAMLAGMAPAQTLIYLNFDSATDGVLAPGTNNIPGDFVPGATYTPSGTELVNTTLAGTLGLGSLSIYATKGRTTAADGPAIAAIPGGLDASGLLPNLPGTKVLACENGIEGLLIEATNGGGLQDFTLEVVWYTTNNAAPNTAGIQEPVSDEAVGAQENPAHWIRYVAALSNTQWWSNRGDSNSEGIAQPGTIANNTLYHDVLVFDYNESTPANSTMKAYRNGVQVGSDVVFNATGAVNTIFKSRANTRRTLAIGIGNSTVGDNDPRGIYGGIDSFALSIGTLVPGTGAGAFVLPTGNVNSAVSDWMMY